MTALITACCGMGIVGCALVLLALVRDLRDDSLRFPEYRFPR